MDENHLFFRTMGKTTLSDLQLVIMEALWEAGETSTAEVQKALRGKRDLAVTTVSTVLSRLEKKGVVTHRREGRGYVYRPVVSRRQVRRSMVADLTEKLFGGDAQALVSHLLRESEIDPDELKQLRERIRQSEENRDDE